MDVKVKNYTEGLKSLVDYSNLFDPDALPLGLRAQTTIETGSGHLDQHSMVLAPSMFLSCAC